MEGELIDLLERWPLSREFDLHPGSNIVVVGAYKGLTMELLSNLYYPKNIIGFEPQEWAANQARDRMLRLENIQSMVYSYGLGDRSGRMMMGEYHTDACSFVNTGLGSREQSWGRVEDANKVLYGLGLGQIHLMVVNVEGYEFTLLPYLKETGWWKHIVRFAIQFHFGFGNDEGYNDIISQLDSEYMRLGGELPTWGYWKR